MNKREAALVASKAAQQKLLAVSFQDRIAQYVVESDSGCWVWTGYKYGNGYSAISWRGKQVLGHRLAYEELVGPIPAGLVIDHLCCVKACINPQHLEPVTSGENTRRAMRSHCVNGHEFDAENTWLHRGKRYCRKCRRNRNQARKEKVNQHGTK
jgi:hypothetical protein